MEQNPTPQSILRATYNRNRTEEVLRRLGLASASGGILPQIFIKIARTLEKHRYPRCQTSRRRIQNRKWRDETHQALLSSNNKVNAQMKVFSPKPPESLVAL